MTARRAIAFGILGAAFYVIVSAITYGWLYHGYYAFEPDAYRRGRAAFALAINWPVSLVFIAAEMAFRPGAGEGAG